MADSYYDKVTLLVPMNGTNNGTSFIDKAPTQKTLTASSAITSTAVSKFYGSSGYFNGAAYVIAADTESQTLTADFTIECWAYGNVAAPCLFSNDISGSAGLYLYNNSMNISGATPITGLALDSTNTWKHLALVRSGSTITFYQGGISKGTTTYSGTVDARNMVIGRYQPNANLNFTGYVQDFRITKGQARYTDAFSGSLPTAFLKTVSGTVTDDTGANTQRTLVLLPRIMPTKQVVSTTSNASTGAWSALVPDVEHTVVCMDDATGTVYNDLVARATPA